MAGLHELVVEQHRLALTVSVAFATPRNGLTEAKKTMIASELADHIADAFETRHFTILEVEEYDVAVQSLD